MGKGLRNFLIFGGLLYFLLGVPKIANAEQGDLKRMQAHKWRDVNNGNIWEFSKNNHLRKTNGQYMEYYVYEEKNKMFSDEWGSKNYYLDPKLNPGAFIWSIESSSSYFFKGETLVIADKNIKLVPIGRGKISQEQPTEEQTNKPKGKNIGDVVNETYSNVKKNIGNLFSSINPGGIPPLVRKEIEEKAVKETTISDLEDGMYFFVHRLTGEIYDQSSKQNVFYILEEGGDIKTGVHNYGLMVKIQDRRDYYKLTIDFWKQKITNIKKVGSD